MNNNTKQLIEVKAFELKEKHGDYFKRLSFWNKKKCSTAYMKKLKKKVLRELKQNEFVLFNDISSILDEMLPNVIGDAFEVEIGNLNIGDKENFYYA